MINGHNNASNDILLHDCNRYDLCPIELCTTNGIILEKTKRNIDGSTLLTINPEHSRRIDLHNAIGKAKVNKWLLTGSSAI